MAHLGGQLRKHQTKASRKRSDKVFPRRLLCEWLEDRRLLAGNVWTQRGGNAGHTGYVDETFDPATLAEVWSQPLGYAQSGNASWFERAVAIDESQVYRTELEGYAPVGTYHVIAYDLETGGETWHRTFQGNAFEGVGEPSVAGGIVYVNRAGHSGTSGGSDADLPRIYGLSAATGATVLERRYEAQWGSNERPVIADNQLVVEDGYFGGISAYTASTLTRQWFVGRSAAYDPPFAALDDQFAYAFGNEVYRRSDGARLPSITHPLGLSSVADPMVSDSGRVFFEVNGYYDGATRNGVSAYDGDTHSHLWTTFLSSFPSGKAVGNGIIAVTAGSHLLFLDEATGREIRSWQAPTNLGPDIVLTQSHVFVQSSSSSSAIVHAIDLQSGQQVWSYHNTSPWGTGAVMEMAFGGGHLLLSHHQFLKAFKVGAANRAPDAVDDSATLDEDTSLAIAVLTNDNDPDGDPLTVAATTSPSHGSVAVNPEGTITYTPEANYHGSDSFTYTIGDGRGGADTATVSVTVSPVNDAPEAVDAVFTLDENSAAGTSVGAINATDIDCDDLSFALDPLDTDAAAFAIDPDTGALSIADPSLLDYETQPQFDFDVLVTDGNGGQATAAVRVNLNDVLEVAIDILPGDPTNSIGLRSKEIAVAILGTATFNPLQMVDLASLRLRSPGAVVGAGVILHPKHGYKYEQRDVSGDGILDLVVSFKTSETGLSMVDSALILEGNLLAAYGGDPFSIEQAVSVSGGGVKSRRK